MRYTAIVVAGCVGCGSGAGADGADGADGDDGGSSPTEAATVVPVPPDRSRYSDCTYELTTYAESGTAIEIVYGAYDASGWWASYGTDVEADGVVDEVWTYGGWNAWGLYEWAEKDEGVDGAYDYAVEGVYDDWLWVSRDIDTDGDGAVDERWWYSPAPSVSGGVTLVAHIDRGADGSDDATVTYEYDERGRLVNELAVEGTYRREEILVYDGDREVHGEEVVLEEGVEEKVVWDYEYPDATTEIYHLAKYVYSVDGERTQTQTDRVEVDEAGRRVFRSIRYELVGFREPVLYTQTTDWDCPN